MIKSFVIEKRIHIIVKMTKKIEPLPQNISIDVVGLPATHQIETPTEQDSRFNRFIYIYINITYYICEVNPLVSCKVF